MPGYQCKCGFSTSRAVALHRHLELNKGRGHTMVTYGGLQMPASPSTSPERVRPSARQDSDAVDDVDSLLANLPSPPPGPPRGSLPSSPPQASSPPELPPEPEKSLLSRLTLSSLWTSTPTGSASPAAQNTDALPVPCSSPLRKTDVPGSNPHAGSSSSLDDPDATWEPVGGVPESEDQADYARITSMLTSPKLSKSPGPGPGPAPAPSGELAADHRPAALGRARGLLHWGRTSLLGDPAANRAACQQASEALAGSGPSLLVSVDDVQSILLWDDPWKSAKALTAGLYGLICLRALVAGNELLQPTTALAAAALAALLYSGICRVWIRHPARASQKGTEADEGLLQQQIANRIVALALVAAPGASAAVTLVVRCLSGALCACILRMSCSGWAGLGASVWLGLALWAAACLGEARVLGQPSMLIVLWLAAFSLPRVYVTCRCALDSLVEEAFQFVADLLHGGQRATLYMAVGLSLATYLAMGGGFVLRISTAVGAAAGFLFWKFHQQRLVGEQDADS